MKVLFYFISILICSCNRSEESKVNIIDILAPVTGEITNLSHIATDIDYVPLQTTDSSIISGIYSMKARGNYLYMATYYEVFCFNNIGKFLFKLSRKGRGPGEYGIINDFDMRLSALIRVNRRFQVIYQRNPKCPWRPFGKLRASLCV